MRQRKSRRMVRSRRSQFLRNKGRQCHRLRIVLLASHKVPRGTRKNKECHGTAYTRNYRCRLSGKTSPPRVNTYSELSDNWRERTRQPSSHFSLSPKPGHLGTSPGQNERDTLCDRRRTKTRT